MTDVPARRVAVVVRVVGDAARIDESALATFSEMASTADAMPGFAGTRLLLADSDSGALVGVFVFESREALAAAQGRAQTAVDVAGVLIGADRASATIEYFDVIEAVATTD